MEVPIFPAPISTVEAARVSIPSLLRPRSSSSHCDIHQARAIPIPPPPPPSPFSLKESRFPPLPRPISLHFLLLLLFPQLSRTWRPQTSPITLPLLLFPSPTTTPPPHSRRKVDNRLSPLAISIIQKFALPLLLRLPLVTPCCPQRPLRRWWLLRQLCNFPKLVCILSIRAT